MPHPARAHSATELALADLDILIIGESAEMARVIEAIEAAAIASEPVLVEGENGTGRELVARAIHRAGNRAKSRFVAIAAASLPRATLDEELQPTALARAHGGTLCLKDIGALPRAAQRELLRLLRRREREDAVLSGAAGLDPAARRAPVEDVRLVATSDDHLGSAVDAGAFEPELFDRLASHRIVLPPLRRRLADLPRLVETFVTRLASELHLARPRLHSRAIERLGRYSWPGNVGELKHVLRALLVRAGEGGITGSLVEATLPRAVERLPIEELSLEDLVRAKLGTFLRKLDGHEVKDLHGDVVARVERVLIGLVLEHTGGNQLRAADHLGMNRNTLRKKLVELGLVTKAPAGDAADARRPKRARR
jgi:two-component system nitrogen regulation response regulator GlnG